MERTGESSNRAVHGETLAGIIKDDLATKRDIKELELKVERDLPNFKADLITWMFAISGAQAALVVTLLKVFK